MLNNTFKSFFYIIYTAILLAGCAKSSNSISNPERYKNYNTTLATIFGSSDVNITSNTYTISTKDTGYTNLIPSCLIDNLGIIVRMINPDSSVFVLYSKSDCLVSYFSTDLYNELKDSIIVAGEFGLDSLSKNITFHFPNVTSGNIISSNSDLMRSYNVEASSIYVPKQQPLTNKVLGILLSFNDSNNKKQYFYVQVAYKNSID